MKLNLKEKLACIDYARKFNKKKAAVKFEISRTAVIQLLDQEESLRQVLAAAVAKDVDANRTQKGVLCRGEEKKILAKTRLFGRAGPEQDPRYIKLNAYLK